MVCAIFNATVPTPIIDCYRTHNDGIVRAAAHSLELLCRRMNAKRTVQAGLLAYLVGRRETFISALSAGERLRRASELETTLARNPWTLHVVPMTGINPVLENN